MLIIVGVILAVLILLVAVGVPGVCWGLKCRKNRGPQISVKNESKPPELIAYGGGAVSSPDSPRRSSTTSVDGSQVGNTRVLNEVGQLIEMTGEILEKQGQTNSILNAIRKYL